MLWKGGVVTSVGAAAVWWITVALAYSLSVHGTTVVNAAELRAVYGHAELNGDTTSRTTKKGSKKTTPTIKPTRTPTVTPSPALSLLAFQPARGCVIRKETTTNGITSYRLSGTVGRNETIFLSDRPTRMAKKTSTQSFVDNFDAMFASSKPNTVISFAEEEDDPLIVVITEARILTTNDNEEDGRLVLEYDIEQLGSQDKVSSIDQFVGIDRQHCSIFVDDFANLTTEYTTPIVKPSPPVPVPYIAAAAEIGTAADVATIVDAVARAADLQAQIITFPENGPFVCNTTLTVCPDPAFGRIVTLPRPDPAQDLSGLCPEDPVRNTGSFSFASYHCLAQLAKHYQMYIAMSMLDMQPCILDSTTSSSSIAAAPYNVTKLCQRTIDTGELVYIFSTIAVFSPDGALVAKYYKNALFGASTNAYVPSVVQGFAQSTPELSKFFDAEGIFTTTFGITFATLICNDINDHSLMDRIKKRGIKDILYANSYENILSLETIGTTLTAASYFYGFNFVAASTGWTAASGSGVFSSGTLLTTHNSNTQSSQNTQFPCTTNLAFFDPLYNPAQCSCFVPPPDSIPQWIPQCVSVRSAMVNDPTTTMTKKGPAVQSGGRDSVQWGSTAASTPVQWTSDFTGYALALPAPGVWFATYGGVYLTNPNGLNFTFGRGSTFPKSSNEYIILNSINQVGILSIFTPPTDPGTYTADLSFNGIKCSASLEFLEGTPAGTGTTRYVFAAYSGDAIFPSTACPESVSYCAVSRCLQFQEETGACITVPGIGVGAPAPLPSEIAQSITVQGTFANTTFPLAYVTDADLQPIDMADLTLSGSFLYEDFAPNPDGILMTDNATHTIKTDGNNAFVTLSGSQEFDYPAGCNVCTNAYDLFNFTDARVPVSTRFVWCSLYKDFGS